MKVIVIGNGPSALENKTNVDQFDVVVRINHFLTTGYEEYVGTKTDILFTCRLNEYNTPELIGQFKEVHLFLLMNPCEGVEISQEVLQSPNITHIYGWNEARVMGILMGCKKGCYPSTGFAAIVRMMERFGHIYIKGFDHFGPGNRHYFNPNNRPKPYRHDSKAERKAVDRFITNGLITKL